ncbi:hypothetical protein Q3C19_09025 [Bacteroides sp. ET489]|uniref:hypothetical protein n=1 Tax=Bacteroides sp. ET489 TaxID=3057126 RepID=UPI00267153EB|nr:hypothetical protein [Bacteroides sp. ET489]MDO3390616.1 hypothetical protein [Bacteroides sp. ET489]
MELKEFIKESLSQIIDAVKETQEKYKDTNVVICPDNIQEVKDGLYILDENEYDNYSSRSKVQNIDMDIAISVTEKEGNKSGLGIAKIINAGISSENTQQNESISKIKFSIPIVLPTSSSQKYFEKHFRK